MMELFLLGKEKVWLLNEVELMNGFEQDLDCTLEDGGTRIPKLIVRDYLSLIPFLRN